MSTDIGDWEDIDNWALDTDIGDWDGLVPHYNTITRGKRRSGGTRRSNGSTYVSLSRNYSEEHTVKTTSDGRIENYKKMTMTMTSYEGTSQYSEGGVPRFDISDCSTMSERQVPAKRSMSNETLNDPSGKERFGRQVSQVCSTVEPPSSDVCLVYYRL